MPRSQINDELLVHEFHLIDVDIKPPFNPPFVLWPAAGFTTISPPEVTVESDRITEGTSDYTYPVLKKGSVSPITLTKGVSMFNTDFWRWITGALSGKNESAVGLSASLGFIPPARRRNLMLLQSSGLSFEGISKIMQNGSTKDQINAALLMPAAGLTAGVSGAASFLSGGDADINMLSVPGRAYMLFGCLPARYKVGSDFDANTTAVSIEELDLEYTRFEVLGTIGR